MPATTGAGGCWVLAALVYGIIEGPNLGWSNTRVLEAFAVSTVLLVVFAVVWEMHSSHPMLDVTFFEGDRRKISA